VKASDGIQSSSQTFPWTVNYVGVTNPGSQANADGDSVSLPITAVDATGGTLTYSATGLPPGLTINSTTGQISGTPAAGQTGNSLVTVTASDGTHTTSRTFVWSVAEVALAAPADQTGTEGNAVSLQLHGTGPAGAALTYSAGTLPAGLSLNSATGLISGTIAAGAAASSPYTVDVAVADSTTSSSQSFTWAVNPHVSLTAPSAQGNQEGQGVALQLQATDPGGTLTYSASGLPPGLTLNARTGLTSGSLAAGAALQGPYVVTATASDGTYSTSQTFNWTVTPVTAPAAPVLSNPGAQASFSGEDIAVQIRATAPGGYPLTYSATGLPDGLSINPFAGTIGGTLADDAVSAAPYSVTVTAANNVGGSSSQTFLWYVTPAPIPAVGVPVSGTEGNDTGAVTAATFTTPDLNSQATDFTATVFWGDGSSDPAATVQGGSGSFTVTDHHAYAEKGAYPVAVVLSDSNPGGTVTANCTATVVNSRGWPVREA
jgi:hypothetical protein